MPGYDPVRDAGSGPERSSPASIHQLVEPEHRRFEWRDAGSHPSDDVYYSRRSVSGQSSIADRHEDPSSSLPMSRHASVPGPAMTMSPRSASSSSQREYQHTGRDASVIRHANHGHSPRSGFRAPSPPHASRRSASIADLITASEMSEAEQEKSRFAARAAYHHQFDETTPGHSMSRSSSASEHLHMSTTSFPNSSSQPRLSPQLPRQIPRTERSPSMAHLLNEGTPGALYDRPRSGSHSSVSSHISQQQQHHSFQQPLHSPLGPPPGYTTSSHPQARFNSPSSFRDRPDSSHSRPASATNPTSGSWPAHTFSAGVQPPPSVSQPSLDRAGSSPGMATVPLGYGGERVRYVSHSGSAGNIPIARSGSTSFGLASTSSSPISAQHVHLQPSPSQRFAMPDLPPSRSPEFRRVPLPVSPTSTHMYPTRPGYSSGQGSMSLSASGAHPIHPTHMDESERGASSAVMPPPSNISPRRGSAIHPPSLMQHSFHPSTPGNGVPPSPGSVISAGTYPVTPGARSLPSSTPNVAYAKQDEESNYFPRVLQSGEEEERNPHARSSSSYSYHEDEAEAYRQGSYNQIERNSVDDYRPAGPVITPGSHQVAANLDRRISTAPLSLPRPTVSPLDETERGSISRAKIPHEGRIQTSPLPVRERDVGPFEERRSSAEHAVDQKQLPASHEPSGIRQTRQPYEDVREANSSDFGPKISGTVEKEWVDSSASHQVESDRSDRFVRDSQPHVSERVQSSTEAPVKSDLQEKQAATKQEEETDAFDEGGKLPHEDLKAEEDGTRETQPAPVPFPRYAPINRVSPPKQVMKPISIDEIDYKRSRCRNPLRRQWEEKNQADSREPLDQILRDFHSKLHSASTNGHGGAKGNADEKEGTRKRQLQETLENAEEVADHYNKRREVGIQGREESPIIGLRKFNNWIKSVLVGQFARGRDPSMDGRARPRGGRILDLGCGKGGDLKKWDKVEPSGLVGADIAAVSIEQAIARHRDNRSRFPGDFFAFDCFSTPLAEVIPSSLLEPMFDNVTLQFCMHYAWENVQKARMMLENVSRYLRRGGIFIGTIPDSRELSGRLRESSTAGDRSFGNRYYKVVFDQTETFPPFGNRYTFYLEDAVENVPEYVVDFDVFRDLAQEVGLECIYRKNFAEIYHDESRHPDFGPLLSRMKVRNRDGSLVVDEDMWQAATLYLGFAFEKVR